MHDLGAPLAAPSFRRLWLSNCAWNLNRWTETVITSWVALQLTGSPWLVALTAVCRSGMMPLLGPFSGALADRFDRVTLLRVAQCSHLTVFSLLGLAMLTGHGAYWQLVVGSLWLGASHALDWPSRGALLADLAGPQHVMRAVILDKGAMSVSRVLGPLIAGVLLALWGGRAYAVMVLLPAFSLLALSQLSVSRSSRHPVAASMWRELREGLAYARQEPTIWAVLLITVVMNSFYFPSGSLYAVMAREVLHVGPVQLGWMGTTNGIGQTLGMLVMSRLRQRRLQGWAFVLGSMIACAILTTFATATSLGVALSLLCLAGIAQAGFSAMQTTLLLSHADPKMRGRAMGLLSLAIGTAAVGGLEMGAIAEQWGAPLAIGANALFCAALVAAIAWRLPRLLHPTPPVAAAAATVD